MCVCVSESEKKTRHREREREREREKERERESETERLEPLKTYVSDCSPVTATRKMALFFLFFFVGLGGQHLVNWVQLDPIGPGVANFKRRMQTTIFRSFNFINLYESATPHPPSTPTPVDPC